MTDLIGQAVSIGQQEDGQPYFCGPIRSVFPDVIHVEITTSYTDPDNLWCGIPIAVGHLVRVSMTGEIIRPYGHKARK